MVSISIGPTHNKGVYKLIDTIIKSIISNKQNIITENKCYEGESRETPVDIHYRYRHSRLNKSFYNRFTESSPFSPLMMVIWLVLIRNYIIFSEQRTAPAQSANKSCTSTANERIEEGGGKGASQR